MSGAVSFQYTSPTLRVPLTSFELGSNSGGQNQTTQRALLVGMSATSLPATPVYVTDATHAAQMFGAGSMLADMVDSYRLNDPFGELWALPIPYPAAGTATSLQVTISGPASGAGTLSFYVADDLVEVAVNAGDTATTVATNLAAAINAIAFPFSANASNNAVNLAAKWPGAWSALGAGFNFLGASAGQVLPPGIGASVSMLGVGTGSPSIAAIAADLGAIDYDFVITGITDSASLTTLQQLMSESAGRWSPMSMIYGHVFMAANGPPSSLITVGQGLNSKHLTVWATPETLTPDWKIAAAVTGAVVPSLKADPARPLQFLAVEGIMAASSFAKTDLQTLLSTGIAAVNFDRYGNCSVVRAVTTYQTNAAGLPDQTYLDTETLFSLMAFIRTLNGAITQKYQQVKLADNGTKFGAGTAVVTPNDIRNELVAQYSVMETNGLVEDTAAFAAGLIVERNSSDASRVDVLLDPILVSGLRIFAALVQFSLQAPASSS